MLQAEETSAHKGRRYIILFLNCKYYYIYYIIHKIFLLYIMLQAEETEAQMSTLKGRRCIILFLNCKYYYIYCIIHKIFLLYIMLQAEETEAQMSTLKGRYSQEVHDLRLQVRAYIILYYIVLLYILYLIYNVQEVLDLRACVRVCARVRVRA